MDADVVMILDSPVVSKPAPVKPPPEHRSGQKRKLDSSEHDGATANPPKHPLLDSIGNRFRQNREEQDMRMAVMESKREAEKQHSRYIKDNVACPRELAKSSYIVKEWAKKHEIKLKNKKIKSGVNVEQSRKGVGRERPLQAMALNQLPSRLNNTQNTTPEHPRRNRNITSSQENNRSTTPDLDRTTTTQTSVKRRITPTSTIVSNDQSEADIIILDRSIELALNESLRDSFNKSSNDLIYINTSNNSNTKEDQAESSGVNDTTTVCSNNKYTCQILNCEAEFSSEAKLGHHTNMFFHSPCNPFVKTLDCKLKPEPILYMCPQCDKQFKTSVRCSDHMRDTEHRQFLPPMAIAGYFCAQCLCVFDNIVSCQQHIEAMSHRDVSYPFADDQLFGPNTVGPVIAPEELVSDLVERCSKAAFHVQCLECSLEIEGPAMLRQHSAETNQTHLMSSLSDTSIVDIFATYLAGYRCDTCSRLSYSEITATVVHQCAPGIVGNLIENNIKSFAEFVKCWALTLTKSINPPRTKKSPVIPQAIAGTSTGLDSMQVMLHSRTKGAIPKTVSEKTKSVKPSTITPQTTVSEENVYQVRSSDDILDLNEPLSTTMVDASTSISQTLDVCSSGPRPNTYKRKRSDCDIQETDYTATAPSQVCRSANKNHGSQQYNVNVLAQAHQEYSAIAPNSAICGLGLLGQRPPEVPRYPQQAAMPKVVEHTQKPADDASQKTSSHRRHNSGPAQDLLQLQESGPSQQRQQSGPSGNSLPVADRSERSRSCSPLEDAAISKENLSQMNNIIFLDLDNWAGFFSKLPRCLPDLTFVWGFYGGRVVWSQPTRCHVFNQMKSKGMFYLNEQCGTTKDAADFAIVLKVGIMNERLPKSVAFTILSGDKGFCEVERQMKDSGRRTVLINPHKAHEFSNDMVYTMVTSVTDT